MSSYSSSSGVPSGALVTRKVDNFAGVDFSNSDTNLSRIFEYVEKLQK